MRPKDVFMEFMTLSYSPGRKPVPKDIPIRNYMINRVSYSGWNIINLYNGTSIRIPWEIVDIFYCLDVWGGDRILSCDEIVDKVDRVIVDLLVLIISNRNYSNKDKFLETLFKICKEGTEDFRNWFHKEFNKILYPIELNSLDNYKTL